MASPLDASDEDLMRRIAEGQEPAFRQLAGRYAARAIGLARRITGNDADADEVVQEALLRVWVNAPRWRPTAAFRTWFYRIVLNLCLNRKRGPSFAPIEQAGDPPDPTASAAARLESDEADRLVAAAIGGLPDRQRAAIVLTYPQGFNNAETAAIMGISVSALEALLVRAKRTLRDQLGPLLRD
jgi:RNA polymerase sigma-70 factor (ECF subfamily)